MIESKSHFIRFSFYTVFWGLKEVQFFLCEFGQKPENSPEEEKLKEVQFFYVSLGQ